MHGVRGTRKVRVDLFCLVLVETDKAVEDVIASCSVVWASLIVWEVVLHRADRKLLLESVDLVQEQNDTGLDEPPRVANTVKESQGLLHTVDGLILEEQLIVFGDGHQEENGRNVLEAMDPLLSLGTLSTDIKHAVSKVADDKGGFRDTRGLDTRSKDILVVGNVVWSGDTVDRVKVAVGCVSVHRNNPAYAMWRTRGMNEEALLFRRVVELVLSRSLETLLHAGIFPEHADCSADLRRKAIAFDLRWLHEDGLNVILCSLIVQGELQRLHGFEDDAHGLDCVAEDDFLE